jgi:hypothetical protein
MNIRSILVVGVAALMLTWSGAAAQTNIVTNGDFEGGFVPDGTGDQIPSGWIKLETFSGGPGEVSTLSQANDNGPTLGGSWSLDWVRSNGGASGDWTACEQVLNYDVTNCGSLNLTIDVKAFSHSLGGSGWTQADFEYPVTIVVYYTDTGGTQRYWQWGWYVWIDESTGPRPDHEQVPGNGVVTGQQVAAGQWVANSFDLLAELTNPGTIDKIRVGGSGWDFEGRADNVQILCAEGWYWKPEYEDYAPSGMPDIDQKQDNWVNPNTLKWSFCGPVAVANCWWWFDSKYNVPPGVPGDANDVFPLVRDYMDQLAPLVGLDDHDPWNIDHAGTPWFPGGAPPVTSQPFVSGAQVPGGGLAPWGELVERLAWYMDTDGRRTGDIVEGTKVDSMQAGIDRWLLSETFEDGTSLADVFYERTIPQPSFAEVESLVEMCEDVILLLGFWYLAPGEQQFIRGDVNEDGVVNMADLTDCYYPPYSCDDAADVNDDGVLNTLDCDYLNSFLTGGGPPPPPPFPACGPDPTPDQLGCAHFPPCPPGTEEWVRVGGHYVTVAGVCSDSLKIAFSDPCIDWAEQGHPGVVLNGQYITHTPPHTDATVHNDAGNVSHDIYSVLEPSPSPGGLWSLPDYPASVEPSDWMSTFLGQSVPSEFEDRTMAWDGESPVFTEVEYAVVVSPLPVNHPPQIIQPDFLEGYVDDKVQYEISGIDPDGDAILDQASISIDPDCGSGHSITRISGSGTSSGTWQVTWFTDDCTPCDTHMVIHDLTDEHGATAYCTTYVHLSQRPDTLWYWKPDTTNAPSGMPDFDQNQDAWVAYCGPTAVANCLWWYGAVPTGWTPPQLIDTLARYFHTSPAWGTYVDTMQIGLEQYIQDYGFAFQESTFEMPNFFEMEDSLKKCQDIILLVGFWFFDEGSQQWYREGGHFVTMAGVCSESLKIAISDPDADRAESGWPGRVRPPNHPPHPGDPLLHNDPTYVSQDMYNSLLDNPFPSPGNPNWEIDYPWWTNLGEFAGVNVPEKFKSVTRSAPKNKQLPYATEVEYAVMICPKLQENHPPHIGQPDTLSGYVGDAIQYTITGDDPDGDVIQDAASLTIVPDCGTHSITRTSGQGTSSGTWQVDWNTSGCSAGDYLVIHDLRDVLGAVAYCTTRVSLYEQQGWYWKDSYPDYAPSGMPDIDQRQDSWGKPGIEQYTFCGPVAVANCFKWFDSKYNNPPGFPGDGVDVYPLVRQYIDVLGGMISPWDDHDPWNVDHPQTAWQFGATTPPPPTVPQPMVPGPQPPGPMPPWGELVERLAWYFNTDGVQTGYCQHAGTNVEEMESGIQMWLESESFADLSTLADSLCEVTTPQPSFAYVESLVHKCEDVILLLGFWYEDPPGSGIWYRIGGHYVTVAGVNSQQSMIALSDPFVDAAEMGLPGRVGDGIIIPHEHGQHDFTVHNDEGNVSHDIYVAGPSPSPGGAWGLPDYAVMMDPVLWSQNFFQQNVPVEFEPQTAPWNQASPIYTEVEYCVHISPWDYRGDVAPTGGNGLVDVGDAIYILNYLFRGGPAPNPYIEGDTNCDGLVNLSDAITVLNYLFKGWPVPKCCD